MLCVRSVRNAERPLVTPQASFGEPRRPRPRSVRGARRSMASSGPATSRLDKLFTLLAKGPTEASRLVRPPSLPRLARPCSLQRGRLAAVAERRRARSVGGLHEGHGRRQLRWVERARAPPRRPPRHLACGREVVLLRRAGRRGGAWPAASARGLEGAYQLLVDDVVLILLWAQSGLGLEVGAGGELEAGGRRETGGWVEVICTSHVSSSGAQFCQRTRYSRRPRTRR